MAQNEIHKIITIEFKNSELIDKMREAQNAIKALNTETKYLKEDLNEYRQQLKSGAISQDQFDPVSYTHLNQTFGPERPEPARLNIVISDRAAIVGAACSLYHRGHLM